MTATIEASVEALCAGLSRERAALEELLFKLTEQNLLLRAGDQQWLPRATQETARATLALEEIGRRRAQLVAEAAADAGLDGLVRLVDMLPVAAPPHLRVRLEEHRAAMTELVGQVQEMNEKNRSLLGRGLAAVNDCLSLLGEVPGYLPPGAPPAPPPEAVRLLDARA